MIDGFDNRLRRRRNTARRDMLMTNNALCAPTKHLFIKQGQGLIDRNHDRSEYYKSAQIGPYRWLSWNFDSYEYAQTDNMLNLHIPWFMRVQELTVSHSACGRPFLKCTCNERKRHGVPCSCFFNSRLMPTFPQLREYMSKRLMCVISKHSTHTTGRTPILVMLC